MTRMRTKGITLWAIVGAALTSMLLLAGCVAESSALPPPEPTEEPVFRPVVAAEVTATPPPVLTGGEIDEVLSDLVCWYEDPSLALGCLPPGEAFLATIQRVALSDDQRFVAPLVDMLWLDVGWERWVREALERLTGQRLATAAEWYGWMQGTPQELPDGYAEWKGRLLAIIDPELAELIPAESTLGGPGPEHLVWSLVSAGAVPPLVSPENVHRVEELYLSSGDVVFGVAIDGAQRAYPERIIGWHGSVTDEVSGVGILVWHCAVCGGAAVFNRSASNGVAYTFRTSGFVWESRRLFTDEETGSLWDAVSGRAVAGPLAEQGVRLIPRMSVRTTWGEWEARYPNTRVLSLDTGHVRDYSAGASLGADSNPEGPAFPVLAIDDRLEPKERVLGVTIGGARKAYPLAALEQRGLTFDSVGGVGIVIYSAGPGRGATVYETAGTAFTSFSGTPADRTATDDEEVFWFVDDERLLNSRNSRVRSSQPAQVAYWFAWSGAFPDAGLWTP